MDENRIGRKALDQNGLDENRLDENWANYTVRRHLYTIILSMIKTNVTLEQMRIWYTLVSAMNTLLIDPFNGS